MDSAKKEEDVLSNTEEVDPHQKPLRAHHKGEQHQTHAATHTEMKTPLRLQKTADIVQTPDL